MGDRLFEFWERYSPCFRTKTRDESLYAYKYLSGLLRMTEQRNFTNIGRKTGVSGQNVQHFDVLPALSTAKVRELLRAAMPLPQLTPEDAAQLVVEHLVNRTRSRKGRMKSKHNSAQPP